MDESVSDPMEVYRSYRGRADKMGGAGKMGSLPYRENHKSCNADILAHTSHDFTWLTAIQANPKIYCVLGIR